MKKLLFVSVAAFSLQTFAGICTIHFDRTACPGMEKDSYAKCDGKKECDQKKKAETLQDCQKLALDSCSNSRLKETHSKIIKALFDGQPIKSAEGNEDFCLKYPNRSAEYDKCK